MRAQLTGIDAVTGTDAMATHHVLDGCRYPAFWLHV